MKTLFEKMRTNRQLRDALAIKKLEQERGEFVAMEDRKVQAELNRRARARIDTPFRHVCNLL